MLRSQHLFSIVCLSVLLAGCAEYRTDHERCPQSSFQNAAEGDAEKNLLHLSPVLNPTVYVLDDCRRLEVWDTATSGHYTFIQDGKKVRTEPIQSCSAAPLMPSDVTCSSVQSSQDSFAVLQSPTIRLTKRDRAPSVIMCEQFSGSPGHYLYTVFEVASGFRKVGQFKSSSPLELVKVGDEYRFSGNDYLPGFGAQQAYPAVILKLDSGSLRLDPESMRKRLPTDAALSKELKDIRKMFKVPSDIPPELFDRVFSFYYCGEIGKAKKFFDAAYPPQQGDRDFWWNFIKQQIALSPYRAQIKSLARSHKSSS
ncbi:MAG TPA: hypothetical protein V6C89_10785 [Drouetiella sp.]|jgi:hypothetical protein